MTPEWPWLPVLNSCRSLMKRLAPRNWMDLYQAVAMKLIRSLGRHGVATRSLVFRMVFQAVADQSRSRCRQIVQMLDDCPSREVSPDLAVEREEFWKGLSKLARADRQMIELRFRQEKSVREIARDTGRTIEATKSAIRRACERLKPHMRDFEL